MPYMLVGNCVHKQNSDGSAGDTVPGGCHDTKEEAKKHMAALYANVKTSEVVEMSLRITKASYNKSEDNPRRWMAIDSDTGDDLYGEKMSLELYQDFDRRIRNNEPVPEAFKSVICEDSWCGGMPYLSVAHYKSGSDARNVPGLVEQVYIDGTRLKSKGTLSDTPIGRAVFDSLTDDLYKKKDKNHLPVRISIGFLDLEHKHQAEPGNPEFTFVRKNIGEICPLCAQGIGGKIYTKGQLVHLAMTRVPVNPRTEMSVEKAMGDDITTKRQDAESIIGDLADELEEKSLADGVLVVRANENGSLPTADDLTEMCQNCYDPNVDMWDQDCVNGVYKQWMAGMRNDIGQTVKSKTDEVVEDAKRKDVSPADKKRAEKKYGDVTYADETNKKYPIDTKEHVQAALRYWGMPKNKEKYSPEDQKKIGGRIHAAAKKFGIDSEKKKSVVEDAMDEVIKESEVQEESVLGVPEQKFNYAGISGDGNNNIPSPVKAKQKQDAEDAKDNGDDEEAEGEGKMKKSFTHLESLVAKAKAGQIPMDQATEQINKAFAELGTEVENAFKPKSTGGVDAATLAEIVRAAVAPLQVEIAQLKSQLGQGNTVSNQQVQSKALTLGGYGQVGDYLQKSVPSQPQRKLTKLEEIAYRSTGAIR